MDCEVGKQYLTYFVLVTYSMDVWHLRLQSWTNATNDANLVEGAEGANCILTIYIVAHIRNWPKGVWICRHPLWCAFYEHSRYEKWFEPAISHDSILDNMLAVPPKCLRYVRTHYIHTPSGLYTKWASNSWPFILVSRHMWATLLTHGTFEWNSEQTPQMTPI